MAKVSNVQKDILAAKNVVKEELSEDELRKIILRACALCGIKDENLPEMEVVTICLEKFNSRYIAQMNKQELALAFELNMQNDLLLSDTEKKVEHFQCFSVEYFCDVVTAYLRKKKSVVLAAKKPDEEECTAEVGAQKFRESQIAILQDILEDYADYHTKKDVDEYREPKQALKFKMDMMHQFVDFDFSEENIIALRDKAAQIVLRAVAKKRTEAISLRKFGLEVELANQAARIKQGKLITQGDEVRIQHEVNLLLYRQAFDKHKPKYGQTVEQTDFYIHVSEAKKEC